jgi:hypothetical protein
LDALLSYLQARTIILAGLTTDACILTAACEIHIRDLNLYVPSDQRRSPRNTIMTNSKDKIRYAVVGLGHIAQVAVLPAFRHAKRNSTLASIVTDDRTRRREIARKYELDQTYSYREWWMRYMSLCRIQMHAEYTIRAAQKCCPKIARQAHHKAV